jgi:deoxyribodipyrimidine photo-lyase
LKINIFWFRRDLRLEDNHGLSEALKGDLPVLPIFIFDDDILEELPLDDARVQFIYQSLSSIQESLVEFGSNLKVLKGKPIEVWKEILAEFDVNAVYTNKDYEPYSRTRDFEIQNLLKEQGASFHRLKDHVIFEEREVMKPDGKPYTVFTPFKKRWLASFKPDMIIPYEIDLSNFLKCQADFPSYVSLGFKTSQIKVPKVFIEAKNKYAETRNYPTENTSYLGTHLRFGTVSIREVIRHLAPEDETFLSELIWREFFIQILYHFPKSVNNNFKSKYDGVQWINNKDDFKAWCEGKTGYPMVDAGMRQLNATGWMHNRVRMVTASFLCKHLLIDWRWGEAYFAKKLLDFELASNVGNWQWAAGTGCDAAPYFRIFNPMEQHKKFDPKSEYVKTWVPEWSSLEYLAPIVEHKMARQRCLETYKSAL